MTEPGPEARPVVLAAPSGAGKTTISRRLVEEGGFVFSVSATTRPPREGEVQGEDYRFVSREEFRRMIEAGELAEWAQVHGRLYGTPRESLRARDSGEQVLLDIDVQGARQIREAVPRALLLFILPPSIDTLLDRLQSRGTEDQEEIRRRLATALQELQAAEAFDFFVINDDLDRATKEVRALARTGAPPPGGPSGSLEDALALREAVRDRLAHGELSP